MTVIYEKQRQELEKYDLCREILMNARNELYLSMRFFDVAELAPYAIESDAYLTSKVHMLWEMLLGLYRTEPARCRLSVIDPLKN